MEKFNVILTGVKEIGAAKLQVIKAVKEACDLSLKEAKDLVDGAPSTLKEHLSKDEAENLKKVIEDVGGKVNIENFEDAIFNNAIKEIQRLQDERLKKRIELATRIGMAIIETIEKDNKININY